MAAIEDQQFCLRWNNFQANITSQFETLRDDEDFTDVTIACEGQRLQAHKVVLSACSPFFKELFKNNPCQHPIIFMRDVEVLHIAALLEFMYAGEVNVAQAHLSGFLKTAESLRIRGLTDTSSSVENFKEHEDTLFLNPQPSSSKIHASTLLKQKLPNSKQQISSSSTVTSSQDISVNSPTAACSPPPAKKQCKTERTESEIQRLRQLNVIKEDTISVNPFSIQPEGRSSDVQPKIEMPDYLSDDDRDDPSNFFHGPDVADLAGGMEIIPQINHSTKDLGHDSSREGLIVRQRRLSDNWLPFDDVLDTPTDDVGSDIFARFRDCRESQDDERKNRLVKLGEGIEIYEDQLRSVKWSDYRKLTRGLATILFSPAELATCSVTGQRWSRAGSGERPVKPALDRAKVQAIISYVATRFPMVEISRIKQVLAYKCKENSTAFKMKAVRFYGDHLSNRNKN